ncbi:uncharacterized protein [Argopecten irradians]|uniref:uncharacterized protein n=1 Tax=Argopecten irradians TaxID=31199 RepID=UPI003712E8DA
MSTPEISNKLKKSIDTLVAVRDPQQVDEIVRRLMDNDLFKTSLQTALGITDLKHHVSKLEDRIDDLEQYSRRNCLKFRGIPESKEEDTDQVIIKSCNETLGVMVESSDISRSHRVGKPNSNYPRDIIVRFISYRVRAFVYEKRFDLFNNRKLRNENGKITFFLNEALTKTRMDVFAKARYLKKQKLISGTWTQDGRIVVRGNDGQKSTVTTFSDLRAYLDPPPKTPTRPSKTQQNTS